MHVNYFYDWTDDKQYTSDDEGNLVKLCADCADDAGDDVGKAGNGDDDSCCELCGAGQHDGDDQHDDGE